MSRACPRTDTAHGTLHIELDHVGLPELAQLVADEQECRPFLSFTIMVNQKGIELEIRSDQGGHDMLSALFEA